MYQNDVEALKKKNLCYKCVGDSFLSDEIRRQGSKHTCSYCGRIASSYFIGKLADLIEDVFDQHYVRTSEEPTDLQYSMLKDKESSYDWEREGEPVLYVIMNSADIPEEAANDIQQLLEQKYYDFDEDASGIETAFSSDSYYQEKSSDDWYWKEGWRKFERSMKFEARFFNLSAIDFLESVFDGIDLMNTRDGRSLIINAGPATSFNELYRARVFQDDKKLKDALIRPDRHLGPPPPIYANAGRMNAHGISVFYCANHPEVALAEVRPPVGSRVAVARFEIVRALRLLDLTALSLLISTGSIFDPEFAVRLERSMFLRSLCDRIVKPVMPNDEPFEYLATQAVADFLANESTIQIDGIIFPSAQTAGLSLNIVLFHKAARVEEIDLPEGTSITASLGHAYEDGWLIEYSIHEEFPPKKEKVKENKHSLTVSLLRELGGNSDGRSFDHRKPTMKIDLESVTVHMVKAVDFKAEAHRVHRYRWDKE